MNDDLIGIAPPDRKRRVRGAVTGIPPAVEQDVA